MKVFYTKVFIVLLKVYLYHFVCINAPPPPPLERQLVM